MKIKIFLCLTIIFFSLTNADNIDYANWKVLLETKDDPAVVTDFHERLEATAKVMIKNMLYSSSQTVEDYLATNSKLSRQFDRNALKLKQTDIRYLSDGSTIYQYELSLTGSIMNQLYPAKGEAVPLATMCCPTCTRPWPQGQPVPENVKLVPMENELTPEYTGILIDARDITLNPSLFPKIFTEEGKEVYSINFADSNYVFSTGLASYSRSYDDIYSSDRLGFNPLRITALKSTGDNKTDIVISDYFAKTMHASRHNLELLEHCQVVILISE